MKKTGAFYQLVTLQRWTLLSLLIVLAMYALATFTFEADAQAGRYYLNKTEGQGIAKGLGGRFVLTQIDKKQITEEILKHRYTLMYVGADAAFLDALRTVYEALVPAQQEQLQVLLVAEPEKYDEISFEGARVVTGTAAEIKAFERLFRTEKGKWAYILGPEGQYLNHYGVTKMDLLAEDLQAILGK